MKEILRKVGFFALGTFSLLYVIFSRNFAEIQLETSFLNFPVFIGEIILFFCLILSFFVFDFRPIKGWQWGVVVYFVFVALKAILGFNLYGPLAFRHAALFYYPVFIFFGFIFFKKNFLNNFLKIFITLFIFVLCITNSFYRYWIFALWIIAFILIKSLSRKGTKYLLYAGLFVTIFLSHKEIILTSRTFIAGNIVGAIFLIIAI